MHPHRLCNGFADGDAWVERRVGVLEHDLGLLAEVTQGLAFQSGHFNAVEPHLAVCRFSQTQDATSQRGLSASRLTNQAQGLTFVNLKAHVIDGFHMVIDSAEHAFA